MKLFLVLAAVICAASAASVGNGQTVYLKNAIQAEIKRQLGLRGILPPFDDPLELNATKVDFADTPNPFIEGVVELIKGTVTGLSTLTDELKFNLLLLTLDGDVALVKGAIDAQVTADALVHLPITGEDRTLVAGVGASIQASIETFSVTTLHAKIHINIATDRGTVSDVDGNIHLDGPVKLNGNGIQWDGVDIDWAVVEADLPGYVADLIENHRPEFLEILTQVINIILSFISISDLIGQIGG